MLGFLRKKNKITSESILRELRQGGAKIGTDVVIYAPYNTHIDKTTPWMLTIGDHVRITDGVRILTHDYAWSVLKLYDREGIEPGGILGAESAVEIGSCVFIGMNTIITRGVKIGDHVVIGAGSVVTKDCESGGVYAGNPAKRIMSIAQFYEKRRACQFDEAKALARQYRQRLGKMPPMEIFNEYFMLFMTGEQAKKVPQFAKQMALLGNLEETVCFMENHKPVFPDYDTFLKACFED